jgi:hypothetical protein
VVLAIVLHDSGRYPDTVMFVVIGDPLAAGGTPSARARQVDSERPAVVRVPATAY